MPKDRYSARYMCSLEEPDETRTWFLIDRELGTPVFDDRGVRLFTRQEVDAILGKEKQAAPGQGGLVDGLGPDASSLG